MKKLIAQFKAMGFKQFALEHVEKAVFGLAAFLVLIFLGGTSWSRYSKHPDEFLKKAQLAEDAIKASSLSAEGEEGLRPKRPLMEDVGRLHSAIDVSRYEYSTHWFWPMYPQLQKVNDPTWLGPLYPVADASKFIMVELPEQQQVAAVAATDKPKEASATSTDDDDDLAPKRPTETTRGASAGATSTPNPAGLGATPGSTGGVGPRGLASGNETSSGGYESSGGGYSAGGNTGKAVNSRGVRFVSVRYLFPLDDQIAEVMKAMNLDKAKAAEQIIFLDFELQRQVAVPGNKPWSGPWEPVDIQAALDILDRVDFDTELVDLKYTDSVITMPLPHRGAGAGDWTKTAYHEKLKKLDEEQAAAQRLIMEKAVEAEEQTKKEDPFRKRGFSPKQHDARKIRQQTSGQMSQMSSDVAKQFSPAGEMSSAMPEGYDAAQFGKSVQSFGTEMQQDVRTTTKYLLFRYFDFAVNPGNAYRYKVRLILRNPNFQKPVEELVDERVALRETRETPWSEPTQPVSIADENRVFLSKAERPKADMGLPSASLEVFQWFADSGMNIFAKLEKLQLGQIISGRPKTEVLRPASGSFKEEEIPIFTGAVLADLTLTQIPTDLDQTEHADLKIDFRKLKQIASVDKALVVDRFGQMMELDPKVNGDDFAKVQKSMANQDKRWEKLKKPSAEASGGNDLFNKLSGNSSSGNGEGSSGGGYSAMMMGSGMDAMMGGNTNPLKKGATGQPSATAKKGAKGKRNAGGGYSSGGNN